MFDFPPSREFIGVPSETVDAESLACLLATMSDGDLNALEDELDFCSFAGVPSPRILTLLDGVTDLDATWQSMLQRWKAPEVPAAY